MKPEYSEISRKYQPYWHTLADGQQVEEETTACEFKVWHDASNTWAIFRVYVGTDHCTIHDYWQPRADRMGQIRALGSWQAMDAAMRRLIKIAGPGEFELQREHYTAGSGGSLRSYSF